MTSQILHGPRLAAAIRGLAGLDLTSAEWTALTRRGFVARERRGRGTLFKLRFRVNGKQRVRYLGKDPEAVQAVRRELRKLQAPRRLERRLKRLTIQARQALRQAKKTLQPLLSQHGLHFYGNAGVVAVIPTRLQRPNLDARSLPPKRQEYQLMKPTPPESGSADNRAPKPVRRRSRRLARINDYLCESLADPDALAANVGAMSSDLMKLEYRLMQAIHKSLAQSSRPLDAYVTLLPAIETCSQLTRQVFRLTDLGFRMRQSRPPKVAAGASATSRGGATSPANPSGGENGF